MTLRVLNRVTPQVCRRPLPQRLLPRSLPQRSLSEPRRLARLLGQFLFLHELGHAQLGRLRDGLVMLVAIAAAGSLIAGCSGTGHRTGSTAPAAPPRSASPSPGTLLSSSPSPDTLLSTTSAPDTPLSMPPVGYDPALAGACGTEVTDQSRLDGRSGGSGREQRCASACHDSNRSAFRPTRATRSKSCGG